jgi:hypothetical protein
MTIPLFEFIEWRSLDDDMIQKDYPSTKKKSKKTIHQQKKSKKTLALLIYWNLEA